jgi:hypothetical protein
LYKKVVKSSSIGGSDNLQAFGLRDLAFFLLEARIVTSNQTIRSARLELKKSE